MFLAFLAYFGFFNLQRVAEAWMEAGVTAAWLGSLWYQLLMLAVVYVVLLSDSYWLRRLMRRIKGPLAVRHELLAGFGSQKSGRAPLTRPVGVGSPAERLFRGRERTQR